MFMFLSFVVFSQERHAEEVRRNKEIREELEAWTHKLLKPITPTIHPHTRGPLSTLTHHWSPHTRPSYTLPRPEELTLPPSPTASSPDITKGTSLVLRNEKCFCSIWNRSESGCRFFVNTICFIWDNEKYCGVPFYKFFSVSFSFSGCTSLSLPPSLS